MSAPASPSASGREELHTQLFANVVMQQAGMALMFLGATPHPETGQTMFDLEGAQHFIAQLEMLEAKTKGNLNTDEAAILKQGLSTARMAFVQAVERGVPTESLKESSPAPSSPEPATVQAEASAPEPEPATDEERKKFVKKY